MERYTAKTFLGLEGVLEEELKQLGAQNTKRLSRAVSFDGELDLLYRANVQLRTALRILHPLECSQVTNQNQLYNFAHRLNWLRWFTPDQTFAVQAKVIQAPNFNNSTFVALKVKDAIVDQFRRLQGDRPSVDKQNPDILIDVYLYKDQCTISIDSSGPSLHRRGYREKGHRAPLNEVLAAGMILLSGWDINTPFVDPFCGTGTIVTEAALIAKNVAPNIKREEYGFKNWKNYDKKLWDKVWLESRAAERRFEGIIIGADVSQKIIGFTKRQVSAAGVGFNVELYDAPFREFEFPEMPGTMISNPPYGERMNYEDVEELYGRIGDRLKADAAGYQAWLISSIHNFNRFIGLRPSKKIPLYNGGLECQYMRFDLYKGTKRTDKKPV